MTYEKIFADVKKSLMKADISKLDREFAIQCNIQGEGAGSFYIAFKEGVFSVEPYDYKDCDAHLNTSGDVFMKMFSGKMKGADAYEQDLLSFEGNVEIVLMLGNLEMKKTATKKAPAKPKTETPTKAETPAPAVKAETPTPVVKAEAPAPVKAETPAPVKAETPTPAKVEASAPAKAPALTIAPAKTETAAKVGTPPAKNVANSKKKKKK